MKKELNKCYEFILTSHIPEILDIENGNIKPIKTEDFKKRLMNKIKNRA